MKKVIILGSTGSIGINTLKVIGRYADQFKVVGLTAYNNHELLAKQIKQFAPSYVAVPPQGFKFFKHRSFSKRIQWLNVEEDLSFLVSKREVDVVVIGMRGSAALEPFLAAVRCGKTVAPANKEALVIAGDIIMREAKKYKATIIPVDSEQSAIFQCLDGRDNKDVKRVILTASGGALRNVGQKQFDRLSVKQILNHPTWKMGKKITVDSATLMNKGFEVIEALRLFNLHIDQIEVVIHPESIIHSMVEFKDGSIIAQMGVTDMRLPIQYALTYPKRCPTGLKAVNFVDLKQLTFSAPDVKKFPALSLAMFVARRGGTLPSVLNAADEVAVEAFLNGQISFSRIYPIVEKIVLKHKIKLNPNLRAIFEADQWAREEARNII